MLTPEDIKATLCQLHIEHLEHEQWNDLFRVLRHKSMAASFYLRLQRVGKESLIPESIKPAFLSAVTFAEAQTRQVRIQLKKLSLLFATHQIEFVMLKGAAYVAADTPNSEGRLMSDIDICVRHSELPDTERALLNTGWQIKELDDYDEKFYRQWCHEIPPYKHPFDGVSLDVHHTLFPPVANKSIDTAALYKSARPGVYGAKYPGVEWLVFHSTIHLIANEDAENGLRDLTDIYELLTYYEHTIDYQRLSELFYQSGFVMEFALIRQLLLEYFAYQVPSGKITDKCTESLWFNLRLWAVRWAICPASEYIAGSQRPVPRMLNYLVGYASKMPILLLIRHLGYKSAKSIIRFLLGEFYFRKKSK
ncbi:nucleotidyltransferase domain-containing protein [Alteromonas gilva]|uniref:Nucleotidyltransferase family protein n=1 Tax=Alteromonas gilva TaxID=2987522 RepID=A0ABT5L0E4_9ALTE|nr:nucleotidyltransferase family protein [Alteromonas gilva]MDC8830353.1 nucleotidyltransferase family protein [Alteromonas gilva]